MNKRKNDKHTRQAPMIGQVLGINFSYTAETAEFRKTLADAPEDVQQLVARSIASGYQVGLNEQGGISIQSTGFHGGLTFADFLDD